MTRNSETMRDHTLVVGSTGLLGMEIVRLLRASGQNVRAMVRGTADAVRRSMVEACGAEIVKGDLRNIASIEEACRGISTVVTTASATLSRQHGDSIQTVDEEGQLALVEAAERAAVRHFIFVSFPPNDIDFALQRAKRSVETRLREGRMSFTVLQPVHFMEVWLSPLLGFDPMRGKARICGDGTRPFNWVSFHDVAHFAVNACDRAGFAGRVLPLAGPDALTPLEVVGLFEEAGAPKCTVESVPESVIEAQVTGASNPLEEAFAALMLTQARGQIVAPVDNMDLLPSRRKTIREYAMNTVRTSN